MSDSLVLQFDTSGRWSLAHREKPLLSDCRCHILANDELEGLPAVYEACQERDGDDGLGRYRETAARYLMGDFLEVRSVVRCYAGRALATVQLQLENTSARESMRIREVVPFEGEIAVRGEDTRILTNAWERCGEEDHLVALDNGAAVASAWSAALYAPADSLALSLGMISAGAMFTRLCFRRGNGGVIAGVRGDTRSGGAGVLLEPGAQLASDSIALIASDCPYAAVEDYADVLAKANNIRPRAGRASGWLDWYCYYGDISEETVYANLDILDRKLGGYGIEYVQIDDGWQRVKQYSYYEEIDLRCTASSGAPWEANEAFPSGMAAVAAEIHRRGYAAGLWIRPFNVMKEAPEYAEGAPWILPYGEGDTHPDRASVDISQPEARDWLGALFRRITQEWGYDYVKFDFVTHDVLHEQAFGPAHEDFGTLRTVNESTTSAAAFHQALRRFRESVPAGTFLLGCNCPAGSAVGAVDGFRISGDVLLSRWDLVRNMLRSSAYRYYLNGTIWQNDPDVLMVSDAIPLNQARFWASYVGLCGGMLMLGDSLPDLSEERIDLLKKVLPPYNGRAKPLRLFEEQYPSVWQMCVEKPLGRWDVAGLYNWNDSTSSVSFRFEELGLPPDQPFLLFDFWEGVFLGEFTGKYSVDIPGAACQVVSIRARRDTPQVLSTQYHLSQGGVELEGERWNPADRMLTIRTSGVAGAVMRLFVVAPDTYAIRGVAGTGSGTQWKECAPGILDIVYTVSQDSKDELRVTFS